MATVSHYAMQPHPAFYGDGSTQLSSSQYYVASNQQLSQMYDKTKKTWSQRLKITKTEKTSMPLSELPDYSPSALSRSMKYTEPWLYGTVRGIPAPSVHGQGIFTPIPAEVAVVVCSCPEYLNGTKKEVKKASVCKKCKGSRLPLAPIGGTVRLRPTSAPIHHKPRACAGTVRLTSSVSMKSRPSILDPKNDPYDLMRRSRLVSPEPKTITIDKSLKLRAKSTSPTRGRSRSRVPKIVSEDVLLGNNGNLPDLNGTLKLRSAPKIKQERWLEMIENDPGGRRSILQCDVNPYDLISGNCRTNNEFAPEQEDIFLPLKTSNGRTNHIQAIGGQRISFADTPGFNRNSATTMTPRKSNGTYIKQDIRRSDANPKKTSSSNTDANNCHPKRPPRRKHDTSSADEDNEMPDGSTKATNEQNLSTMHSSLIPSQPPPPPPQASSSSPPATGSSLSSNTTRTPTTTLSFDPSTLTLGPRQGIKSILKRPSSVTSTTSSEIDAKINDSVATAATDVDSLTNKSTSSIRASVAAPRMPSERTRMLVVATATAVDPPSAKSITAKTTTPTNMTGSQFYLPLPQIRKKVQFMVENRIIHHETEENDSRTNGTGSSVVRNENSSSKRKDLIRVTTPTLALAATNNEQTFMDATSLKDEMTMVASTKQQEILDLLQFEQNEQSKRMIEARGAVSATASASERGRRDDARTSIESRDNCVIIVNGNRNVDDFYQDKVRTELQDIMPAESKQDAVVRDSYPSNRSRSPNRKTASLRRTNSARTNNTTTVLLNFNDTMALRTKPTRPDSREVFSSPASSSLTITPATTTMTTISRPKENPPPPPPQATPNQQRQHSNSFGILSPAVDMPSAPCPVLSLPLNFATSDTPLFGKSEELIVDAAINSTSTSYRPSTLAELQQGRQRQQHFDEKMQYLSTDESRIMEQKLAAKRYSATASAFVAIATSDSSDLQPSRPPRQPNKKLSWQENGTIIVKNEQDNSLKDNSGSDKENNNKMNGGSSVNGNEESDCSSSSNSSCSSSDSSRNSVIVSSSPTAPPCDETTTTGPGKSSSHSGKMTEKEKALRAQNEILNGARLFGVGGIGGLGSQNNGVQKTVVRVAPFNKTTSEIHRLKIRHEDDSSDGLPPGNVSQKKTSILINGDNCYSTVNVGNDTPLYQSSVVVNNGVSTISTETLQISANTVTINVSNPPTPEEDLIYKNNKINTLLSRNGCNNKALSVDDCSSTSPLLSSSLSSPLSSSSSDRSDGDSTASDSLKRGSTLITLDFGPDKQSNAVNSGPVLSSHEQELVKILRNPVEAVKRNLVPHVCGKLESDNDNGDNDGKSVLTTGTMSPPTAMTGKMDPALVKHQDRYSFIDKLLEDPTLHQLAEGLENEVVVKLIESSLKRLKDSRASLDTSGTKDNEDMTKLIDLALQKVHEERLKMQAKKRSSDSSSNCLGENGQSHQDHDNDSNQGSISSGNSYGSANYDLFDFDNNESDCYQSCSSEMTTEEDANSTRSRFYQMLVDATLSEIEITTSNEDDHHYESIRLNCDPIYEEIGDVPPPLPLSPPPVSEAVESEKRGTRSMFEGASKYDILSYLVDAKERGLVREEPYEYNFSNTSEIIVEEDHDTLTDLNNSKAHDISGRISHHSVTSDSSEDISLTSSISDKLMQRRPATEVERNDSGVGSETSKSSRSKYQNPCGSIVNKNSPIHLCEDCDGPVETQITDSGVMYAPLVCRKCGKKRSERKEIIIEIVETEEKYGRDLQIILEEFCKPMLVAGLLTQEQLSAIFLNTEELIENNQALAEKMRDALDIAMEQGDDDLLTVNAGKIFLDSTPMLHAFETYCVRQASASLLLANLEKDKELLRIFLRVSQMENAVLRRMNLNSFLMVPVQRVTKYPLLLARLYKVTPQHLEHRPLLKQAQEKIELHLNHMNQEAKDVPTKLWRRISSSSPNRRSSCEIDMINIKLRKMAIDILEWNHDEVRFAMEGKLLYTQPTDSNWKKARTIKLTHINALLVTNGKPSPNYKPEKASADQLNFPKHTGIREASLLMVKEKCGRYTLIREPLYLDRCIVCTEADWDDYFEVHEVSSKDTFMFKAEDGMRTKQWYTQLQYHAQGMGAWRKRRNALANIMINGMLSRT